MITHETMWPSACQYDRTRTAVHIASELTIMLAMPQRKSATRTVKRAPPKLVVAIVSLNAKGGLTATFDQERLRKEWAHIQRLDTLYAAWITHEAVAAVQETVIFIERHKEALLMAAGFGMKEILKFAGDVIKDHFKQLATRQTNRLYLYGPDGQVAAVFEAKEGKVKGITSRARRRAAELYREMRAEIESSMERLKK